MGETANTAQMAEKLCNQLLGEFLWTKVGPTNQSWACALPEKHDVTDHPSDVVYFYDEPYSAQRTYLQCDLKSYAKSSIAGSAVRAAVESLAKQVACAEKSDEWRDLYAHDHVTYTVTGVLIIYNHDGEYDANFGEHLKSVHSDRLDMPKDSKLVVLGPKDVFLLDNIRFDIRQLRGVGGPDGLPPQKFCRYFYPQLAERANVQGEAARAATVEMLTSPWVILEHTAPDEKAGVVVYYKREGKGTDEFIYLLDYLRQRNLLKDDIRVRVRVVHGDAGCTVNFQKARQRYQEEMGLSDSHTDLARHIDAIEIERLEQVKSIFSSEAIGMGYE